MCACVFVWVWVSVCVRVHVCGVCGCVVRVKKCPVHCLLVVISAVTFLFFSFSWRRYEVLFLRTRFQAEPRLGRAGDSPLVMSLITSVRESSTWAV